MLKDYIDERCIEEAVYMLKHRCTLREVAKHFGLSKSTIHKDVTERLLMIDHWLYDDMRVLLDINKADGHLRGGNAMKAKYAKK